jgi:hypothetical protein
MDDAKPKYGVSILRAFYWPWWLMRKLKRTRFNPNDPKLEIEINIPCPKCKPPKPTIEERVTALEEAQIEAKVSEHIHAAARAGFGPDDRHIQRLRNKQ